MEKFFLISADESNFSVLEINATAHLLKNFDLRSYSGPFDRLFTSMLIVLEGVSDEFSYFLDRNYYKVATSLSNKGGAFEAYDYEYSKEKFGIEHFLNHHASSL